MKNILLLVHEDAGQEARLQTALSLTRAVNGHLKWLDVVVLPELAGDPYMATSAALLFEHEQNRAEANRRKLCERLTNEDVSWSLDAVIGDITSSLTRAAAMADIIVVDRSAEGVIWSTAGDLIVKSGKPVLTVSPGDENFNPCGCSIVAWNGSSSSIAALQATTPLLRLSTSVILLEIEDGSVEISSRDAASYLSRHGVHALIRYERPKGRKVSDILLEEVHDRGADYVVMGGFGHSRLTQTLFGGVTRTLLAHCPVPMVLMHG